MVKIDLIFKPYRQDEPIEGRFFIIPKALFGDNYKGLSSEAKLLYGLLLDRMELSRKNNYVDENGELYIFFEREEVQTLLETGKNKPTELFKELSNYGLIRERRQGVKKANIVYVGKVTPGNRESQCDMIPENRDSRLPEIGILDSRKSGGSDPDLSDPDLSEPEIKSIRDFSENPEKSSPPFQDNKNYSEWIRIVTVKFPDNVLEYALKRFIYDYKRHIGEEHPILENSQLKRCFDVLDSFFAQNDIDNFDAVGTLINKYFETNFPNADYGRGSDYRFNHFCTEGVLLNRFYEACY